MANLSLTKRYCLGGSSDYNWTQTQNHPEPTNEHSTIWSHWFYLGSIYVLGAALKY